MTAMNGMAGVRAPEAALAIPRLEDGFANMREPLRQPAESVVNEMMSAEADRLCEATGSSRSGCRERGLVTRVGTLAPGIPRLRTGSLFPDDVPGRCQRVDGAAVAAVGETCAGVFRQVDLSRRRHFFLSHSVTIPEPPPYLP